MYQIKRKNRVVEQLQLVHANGEVACVLDVDINVDEIGGRINKAYELVGIAQLELEKDNTSAEAAEAYGKAVLSLLQVIFGDDGCQKLVDFYGSKNAWTEMLIDLFPFINNEIIPKVREASEERKKQLLEMANAAKATGKRNGR